MITIFYYNKGLKSIEFSKQNLKRVVNKHVWIDIEKGTKDQFLIIQELLKLHPLTIEDLMGQPAHVKIEEFPNYLFVLLKGIETEDSSRLAEIDFALGKNFLITNHRGPRTSVQQLIEDQNRLGTLMNKGMDFLLHHIIDIEVDNYLHVIESFDEKIEALEATALGTPRQDLLHKIIQFKKKLGTIRKETFPQREMIGRLSRREYKYISQEAEAYFRDVYDHAMSVSNTMENQREALAGVFDVYMSSVSNSMNEVMKVLSIIATIMLPLTFITGIYGMNFKFLPGSQHIWGFWITIGFMMVLAIFMLIIFRKNKWI